VGPQAVDRREATFGRVNARKRDDESVTDLMGRLPEEATVD
jgi:hypothetical protein